MNPVLAEGNMAMDSGHIQVRIAAYLAQQIETRAMVIGAMIYPAVIGFVAVSAIVVLLLFVIPTFQQMFASFDQARGRNACATPVARIYHDWYAPSCGIGRQFLKRRTVLANTRGVLAAGVAFGRPGGIRRSQHRDG